MTRSGRYGFLKTKHAVDRRIGCHSGPVGLGVAMMGSIAGAKPKSLPVALVVLDQPAELPNGEPLAVGDMMKGMLQGNSQLPIQWKIVNSEAEAREGLDSQKYYGALVLPEDLSASILSLQSPDPKPAVVQVLVNEG